MPPQFLSGLLPNKIRLSVVPPLTAGTYPV